MRRRKISLLQYECRAIVQGPGVKAAEQGDNGIAHTGAFNTNM